MNDWISVKERMPEKRRPVLLAVSDGGQVSKRCIALYDGQRWHGIGVRGAAPYELHGVTHWMPLPEPPK